MRPATPSQQATAVSAALAGPAALCETTEKGSSAAETSFSFWDSSVRRSQAFQERRHRAIRTDGEVGGSLGVRAGALNLALKIALLLQTVRRRLRHRRIAGVAGVELVAALILRPQRVGPERITDGGVEVDRAIETLAPPLRLRA